MMENRVYSCRMKVDLERSSDKILFLKENWVSLFDDIECGSMGTKDDICARCLLSTALKLIQNERKRSIFDTLKIKWNLLFHKKC